MAKSLTGSNRLIGIEMDDRENLVPDEQAFSHVVVDDNCLVHRLRALLTTFKIP